MAPQSNYSAMTKRLGLVVESFDGCPQAFSAQELKEILLPSVRES